MEGSMSSFELDSSKVEGYSTSLNAFMDGSSFLEASEKSAFFDAEDEANSIVTGKSFPSTFEMGDMAETTERTRSLNISSSAQLDPFRLNEDASDELKEMNDRLSAVLTEFSTWLDQNGSKNGRSVDYVESDSARGSRSKKRELEEKMEKWRKGISSKTPAPQKRLSSSSTGNKSTDVLPELVDYESEPESECSSRFLLSTDDSLSTAFSRLNSRLSSIDKEAIRRGEATTKALDAMNSKRKPGELKSILSKRKHERRGSTGSIMSGTNDNHSPRDSFRSNRQLVDTIPMPPRRTSIGSVVTAEANDEFVASGQSVLKAISDISPPRSRGSGLGSDRFHESMPSIGSRRSRASRSSTSTGMNSSTTTISSSDLFVGQGSRSSSISGMTGDFSKASLSSNFTGVSSGDHSLLSGNTVPTMGTEASKVSAQSNSSTSAASPKTVMMVNEASRARRKPAAVLHGNSSSIESPNLLQTSNHRISEIVEDIRQHGLASTKASAPPRSGFPKLPYGSDRSRSPRPKSRRGDLRRTLAKEGLQEVDENQESTAALPQVEENSGRNSRSNHGSLSSFEDRSSSGHSRTRRSLSRNRKRSNGGSRLAQRRSAVDASNICDSSVSARTSSTRDRSSSKKRSSRSRSVDASKNCDSSVSARTSSTRDRSSSRNGSTRSRSTSRKGRRSRRGAVDYARSSVDAEGESPRRTRKALDSFDSPATALQSEDRLSNSATPRDSSLSRNRRQRLSLAALISPSSPVAGEKNYHDAQDGRIVKSAPPSSPRKNPLACVVALIAPPDLAAQPDLSHPLVGPGTEGADPSSPSQRSRRSRRQGLAGNGSKDAPVPHPPVANAPEDKSKQAPRSRRERRRSLGAGAVSAPISHEEMANHTHTMESPKKNSRHPRHSCRARALQTEALKPAPPSSIAPSDKSHKPLFRSRRALRDSLGASTNISTPADHDDKIAVPAPESHEELSPHTEEAPKRNSKHSRHSGRTRAHEAEAVPPAPPAPPATSPSDESPKPLFRSWRPRRGSLCASTMADTPPNHDHEIMSDKQEGRATLKDSEPEKTSSRHCRPFRKRRSSIGGPARSTTNG